MTTWSLSAGAAELLHRLDVPMALTPGEQGLVPAPSPLGSGEWAACVPAVALGALGDAGFRADYGVRYACLAGSMANGIASAAMVIAMGKAGMLGFLGTGGMPLPAVKEALDEIQAALGEDGPYGFNLLNNPTDPDHEEALVDLYIERRVRRVEASAYLRITAPLVRYRLHGIHRGEDGRVVAPNRIAAKVSRAELAAHFFAPAPERLLKKMCSQGVITEEQAELAREIPVAQEVTAEADSGGHTDNRPALALLPILQNLARQSQAEHGFAMPLRVGLAGGIGTPEAVAAAFSMGAAYVMTGSINQSCVEAGTSETVRRMLGEAKSTDVAMAPSAVLFEIGGKVQVLKKGTMFAMRANKLYDLYRDCPALEDIPEADRSMLEEKVFRAPLETVWEQTKAFFAERDPKQVEKAEKSPKNKMALVFRSYLGQASRWAHRGEADREEDYQIWCGPAMGAFNEWAAGSALESVENRRVAEVNLSLLYGAAVRLRVQALRAQGVDVSPGIAGAGPVSMETLAPFTAA